MHGRYDHHETSRAEPRTFGASSAWIDDGIFARIFPTGRRLSAEGQA